MLAFTIHINLIPDKTIVPLLAIFLCVVVMLTFFVFRPVLRILDLRHDKTSKQLERAHEIDQAADEMDALMREGIARVRSYGATVRNELRLEAERQASGMLEASWKSREKIIAQGRRDIERRREYMSSSLEEQVSEVSALIVKHATMAKGEAER